MKKVFIFITLLFACLSITGCKKIKFDESKKILVVGLIGLKLQKLQRIGQLKMLVEHMRKDTMFKLLNFYVKN